MSKVILDYVPARPIRETQSLQPQIVQAMGIESASLYIDAKVSAFETNRANVTASSADGKGGRPDLLMDNFTRVGFTHFGGDFRTIPNVNPRNNNLKFELSTGETYNINILEGLYDTVESLLDIIVDSMNAAVGGLVTFSHAVAKNNKFYRFITVDTNSYKIDPTCSMVEKGETLINLPTNGLFTPSKIVGPINLLYTPYVDLLSVELHKYSSRPNSSNNRVNRGLILRLFIEPPDPSKPSGYQSVRPQFRQMFNYKKDQGLYTIDFQLIDQFGDELYIPNYEGNSNSGFNWNISLYLE